MVQATASVWSLTSSDLRLVPVSLSVKWTLCVTGLWGKFKEILGTESAQTRALVIGGLVGQ